MDDTAVLGGLPTTPDASQQSVSNAPDGIDAIVEAKVKASLEAMKPQLEAEIERKAQSLSDKHYARAVKQFNQDRAAIDRIAKLDGWDAKKVSEAKKAAWDQAFLETNEPDEQPVATAYPEPQALDTHKRQIEAHLQQVFGIAPGQLDLSEYLKTPITQQDDPRIGQIYAKAREFIAKGSGASSPDPRDAELAAAAQQFGGLGGLGGAGGKVAANNPIENIDDPDALWKLARKSK